MKADILANFNSVCWNSNAYSAEWNTAFRKGLWNWWPEIRIPTEGREYSLFESVQTGSGSHLASYAVGVNMITSIECRS